MFDRLLMPALTFTLLAATLGAFAADMAQSRGVQPRIVQLEPVVVSAQRELPATPLAQRATDRLAAAVR